MVQVKTMAEFLLKAGGRREEEERVLTFAGTVKEM